MRLLNRLFITCLLGTVIVTANAQNRYWVIPPNYVDFYTGQVLPLPNTAVSPATTVSFVDLVAGSSTTISGTSLDKGTSFISSSGKRKSSNGYFSDTGDLQFYLNNKVFVTTGKTILYTSEYSDDLPIIPVPGKCNYFFLVSDWSPQGTLNYKEISKDGSSVITKSLPIAGSGGIIEELNFYASTKVKINTSGLPESSLFFLHGRYLHEIKVAESGFTLIQSIDMGGYAGNEYLEMEISNDERYVAFIKSQADGINIFIFDRVLNGTIRLFNNDINSGSAVGLEFSPTSDKLFFVLSNELTPPGQDKIGFIDLNSVTIPSNLSWNQVTLSSSQIWYMPNTNNFGGSFIENAVDGYMYVSDGSNLRGFDPQNHSKGITKSISLLNSQSTTVNGGSSAKNYYTLNKQVDNVSTQNFFQVGCITNRMISNVTSFDGSLTPIVKVSQTIETANTVTVTPSTFVTFKAGDQILLKPGFTVNAGGNFRGRLEACDDFVIDYCSGGGGRMGSAENTGGQETRESFIDVFPTLTTGIINLKAGNTIKLISVQIVSSEGKSVLINNLSGKEEVALNVSHLSDGVYILQIRHQSGIEIRRIVLIK